ncbi:hypothetical protein [Acetobacter okinawensis]|uniref:Uncharacterized protein n=1 Tax=Acetobacter okinawensis TaxID=1076594 RepID=A0A252BVE2_9PROT|nr:hypothetical protein [Acetobacter okinawensis]OUJ12928.1 hypothetical protein HK26_12305 [Acetobacter okinawensis]
MTQAETTSSDDLVWLNCVEPLEDKAGRTPHSVMLQLPKKAIIASGIDDSDNKKNKAKLFRLTISEQVSVPFSAEVDFFSYYPLDMEKILTGDKGHTVRAVIAFSSIQPAGSAEQAKTQHYMSGYLAELTSRGIVVVSENNQTDDLCRYYYRARIASVQELLTHSMRRCCYVGVDLKNTQTEESYREIQEQGDAQNSAAGGGSGTSDAGKEQNLGTLKEEFNALTQKSLQKSLNNDSIEMMISYYYSLISEEKSNIKADVDFLWFDDNKFRPSVNMATQFDETDANFLSRMGCRYGYYWVGYFPPLDAEKDIEQDSAKEFYEKIRFTNLSPQNLSNKEIPVFELSVDPRGSKLNGVIKLVSASRNVQQSKVKLQNLRDMFLSMSSLLIMGGSEEPVAEDGSGKAERDYFDYWRYNEEISLTLLSAACIENAANFMKQKSKKDASVDGEHKNRPISDEEMEQLIKESRSDMDKIISDEYKAKTQYICALRENEIDAKSLVIEGKLLISPFAAENYTLKVGQPFKISVDTNSDDANFLGSLLGDQYGHASDESGLTFVPMRTELKLVFVLPEVAGIPLKFKPAMEQGYSENSLSMTAHAVTKKMQENPFFCLPPNFRDVFIPGLMRAQVCGGENDDAVPVIDKYGYYKIKYPFPIHFLNSTCDEVGETLPVPLIAFSGGCKTNDSPGLYIPLINGTDVLVAFQEGNPDAPCIVGTTPDIEIGAQQKAIFANERQSILQTHRGVSIRMNYSRKKI